MKAEFEEEKQDNRINLSHLIQRGNVPQTIAFLEKLAPTDIARPVDRLDQRDQTRLLEVIGPAKSAALIFKISGSGATGIVERISPTDAAPIVQDMGSDQQARILRKLEEDDTELILPDIQPHRANENRQLMRYPENTAGGLMITEYLSYTSRLMVHDVLEDLRQHGEVYSDYDIQYAYVISDTGKLIGVLRLRDLLLAPKSKPISTIASSTPSSIRI